MTSKVSVIIPCYNEPRDLFTKSLESIINQTLKDIQIIIVLDNPENIDLRDTVLGYKSEYKNILFLEPEKNLGRGMARNLAIDHANGKYIAIHDADDIDYPHRLEDQYNYMENNPDTGIVFSNKQDVNYENQDIEFIRYQRGKKNSTKQDSFFKINKNHPTMFIKTEIMKKYRYKHLEVSEDFDLWMRLFKNKESFGYINKTHTRYLHPMYNKHSNYIKKIRAERFQGIKIMLSHIKDFYKDPYFYRDLLISISECFMLIFGEKTYKAYRNNGLKLAIKLEEVLIKKEA